MIRVRPAKKGDLDDVVAMASRLAVAVADPVPKMLKRTIAAALFGPDRWAECFVAVDGVTIIGFATASRYFEAHTGKRQLRIADFFVDDSTRGAGVGRSLFARLLSRAQALHCDEIAWEVWKENLSAYGFYERMGAQHINDVTTMRLQLGVAASRHNLRSS